MKILRRIPSRHWFNWLGIGFVVLSILIIVSGGDFNVLRLAGLCVCFGALFVIIADLIPVRLTIIFVSLRLLGLVLVVVSLFVTIGFLF
jgi:hypothetical protein